MKISVIGRKACFSPHSVESDAQILDEVVQQLLQEGHDVTVITEDQLTESMSDPTVRLWLSMGRLPSTVAFLKQREAEGSVVVNSAFGVEACTRSRLEKMMREHAFPMPPLKGEKGYWLKRGDAAAQESCDVCYAPDEETLNEAKASFLSRGITDVVVSAHVEGDLVKFYGVEGTGFFRTYYPTADGVTKFGDEWRNGAPHYYDYDKTALQAEVERLSRMVRTPVYGGDCIVTAEGNWVIIDFNDWPSFRRCPQEAGKAIASLALRYASNRELPLETSQI